MHCYVALVSLAEAWDEVQVLTTGPVVAAGAGSGLLFSALGIVSSPGRADLSAIVLWLMAVLLVLVGMPLPAFLIVRALGRAQRRRTASLVRSRGGWR